MVDEEQVAGALRAHAGWLTVMGVLMTIFGVLSIASPLVTGIAVAYLVGGVVLVAGVIQLAHAFRSSSWGTGVAGFLVGLLAVVCGALMLAHPLFNLNFLALLLAMYFVIEGVATITMAMQMHRTRGRGWILLGGVASLVLGALIWMQWPLSGTWAVGILVGVRFLFTGWSMIAVGAAARGAAGSAPQSA